MRRIVAGQHVNPAKSELAVRLRQQMTPEEKLLWRHLRGDALNYHFRRQQVIDGYIVDFYCHTAGLVIELDGRVHLQQSDYDAARDAILQSRGLSILRVTNDEVTQDITAVLARIKNACAGGSEV